ncbi:GNAT family N-acetyltransferase [Brevibacillus humidisoli]|uniref:GNAT family N-acetyltransferase n=1 Tax=Brevibacillus humidisoli TaxID=2895522 RepID=UPI001E52BD40|nr:GNAT family N-acetyltransferase [Brevibacillus humidisoli]UFJ39275.1 GNAT family N-acetyltransferase [Brevibacillus humidisoli]
MKDQNRIGIAQSERIRLRHAGRDDLPFILRTEGETENRQYVSQWSGEQHHTAMLNNDYAYLLIEALAERRPLGYVIIAGLKNPNRSVELLRIALAERGKGYGREALQLIKHWVFTECRAHRLWLDVKEGNGRAQHLYRSEGFVIEGTLRECIKVEGSSDDYESLIVMSILSGEYGTA